MAGSTAVLMAALVAVTLVALNAAQEPAWTAGCGDCNKKCVTSCEQAFQRPCSGDGPFGLIRIDLCLKTKLAVFERCKSGCYRGKCAALVLNGCPGDVDKLCIACRNACNDGSCTSDECRADCVSTKCVSESACSRPSP